MNALPISASDQTASFMGHAETGKNPIVNLAKWMVEQGVSPEAFVRVNDAQTVRLRHWADQALVPVG